MGYKPREEVEGMDRFEGHHPDDEFSDAIKTIAAMPAMVDANARRLWLEERRLGLGASDIATIMGWSTFQDAAPYKVWAQKVGLIPPGDDEDNEMFRFGRMAEPMLCRYYQEETGLYVAAHQELRRHPKIPIAIATIDGEVYEGPVAGEVERAADRAWAEAELATDILRGEREALGGVEFKTSRDAPSKWETKIPDYYQCQGQWQMAVCGWPFVDFAVLHGFMFRVYRLERDEADIAVLLTGAQSWWDRYVVTGDPPPIDGLSATSKVLRQIYPGRVAKAVELDMSTTAALLREAKEQQKKWKESVNELENQIKEAMGDATSAQLGAGWTASWSRFTKKSVAAKALKDKYPSVYREFVKESDTSRFTLKDPAGADEEDQF
jgi:putative phage-type endonuclease